MATWFLAPQLFLIMFYKLAILTKDGVGWVHGHLVLGSVPDEPLRVGERHIAGRRPVPL